MKVLIELFLGKKFKKLYNIREMFATGHRHKPRLFITKHTTKRRRLKVIIP